VLLGAGFIYGAYRLMRAPSRRTALRLYLFSLAYLALLFGAIVLLSSHQEDGSVSEISTGTSKGRCTAEVAGDQCREVDHEPIARERFAVPNAPEFVRSFSTLVALTDGIIRVVGCT
jgi:hypothetical protein